MKTLFLLPIFLFVIATNSFSQDYSVKSKKAISLFEQALKTYESYNYDESIFFCESALEKEPNFIEVYYLLSDIYSEQRKYEKKIQVLKKAIEINPTKNANAYFSLSKAEMLTGKYSDAKIHLEQLRKLDNFKKFENEINENTILCDFALNLIANPVEFKPINLGENINSKFDEYLPAISADESKLIYTVSVPRNGIAEIKSQNDTQEDFFISIKDNSGVWLAAHNFGAPVNTEFNEGAQTISSDGKILFFTSCDNAVKQNAHGKSYGSCDIFVSYKKGNEWTEPENVGTPVNSYYWESQPSFSSDGKTLFFVSNRPGGFGGIDIWYCKKKSDGSWGKAVNAGKNVNTSKNEQSPFIHHDNKTLYFSSDGHLGMGRSDLFMCVKDSSGNFGIAKNLGYPINTWNEEFSLILNAKGNKAYFSASYPQGFGGMDLYEFDMPEIDKPEPVYYIEGVVYDSETLKKLKANFYIFDLTKGDTVTSSFSDDVTGEFLICIPQGKYAFNVDKEGYLFYSQNFVVKKSDFETQNGYKLDVPLSPIKVGYVTILNNVFFDTDSYVLKPESNVELDKTYNFLIKNPNIKLEIGGHTDNTGNEQHNKILSENRAKSVYEYLILKGISAKRLSFKGFASQAPFTDNETEQNRALNRRTEIKVVGI